MIEIDASELVAILNELYPTQLAHAVAETKARKAAKRIEALEARVGELSLQLTEQEMSDDG